MSTDAAQTDELILSPHEILLLQRFADGRQELSLTELCSGGELELAQGRSAIERLKMKDGVEQTAEQVTAVVSLTEKGLECAAGGLPELRLWSTLSEQGAVPIKDLQQRDDLDRAEAGAAFGARKKQKAIVINKGQVSLAEGADRSALDARQALVSKVSEACSLSCDALSEQENAWLKDKRLRGLFKIKETKLRSYRLTPAGLIMKGQAQSMADELSRLTPAMLKDGSWKGKRFRRYAIGLPPRLVGGYRNGYRAFLDRTKATLIGLGFEEMRGSLVENEFWNMDALFLPQFHPAREIHDVYFVEHPTHAKEVQEPHLSNIAAAHEGKHESLGSRGWGYTFDKERTKRLVLRSQGTALSARTLGQNVKIPGKYFGMARCFRYDTVDATHAADFFQVEGIVVSDDTSFRHLLGLLRLFAYEVARAKEVRFVPAYFPFTEPSVEVHMRHPSLGWVELGGAGIFRPEVSKALGVDAPVIAWGLGLDRMAMMALCKNDIRHLFTNNLPKGLADNRPY